MRALPSPASLEELPTTDREIIPSSAPSQSDSSLVFSEHTELQQVVGDYRIHAATEVIPTLAGEEFDAFVQEIKKKGQREPVVVWNGILIAGVDEVKAIGALKERGVDIDLQTVEWQPRPEQTVAEFLIHKYLSRPRFTDAQRAQIVVDLQPFIEKDCAAVQEAARIQPGEVRNPSGINKHAEGDDGGRETHPPADARERNRKKRADSTAGRLARLGNVTEYAVRMAQRIKNTASADDIAAVKAGTKKPKDVLAKTPPSPAHCGTAAASPTPIDHSYEPQDDRERAALRVYVKLFNGKGEFGLADKDYLLDAFKRFRAHESSSRNGGGAK